ncbi:MAG: hypothetical protein V3V01_11005 [Acidimicrobiales bacterium]
MSHTARRTPRIFISLIATALIATTVLVNPLPSSASSSAPNVSRSEVDETVDFATVEFADPWDFTNSKDLPIHKDLNYFKMTNASRSNGIWRATTESFSFIRLLQSWDNSGIPWGRDGALHEIDTGVYDRISFRMKTTLDQPRSGGRVIWYDCGQLRSECQGGTKFVSEPGWHTYDIPLVNDSGSYAVDWAGKIRGLSLMPSRLATDFELDWVRLYDSSTKTSAKVTPASTGDVYWDSDTDKSNNTASNPAWGLVEADVSGNTKFNAGAYPPGSYYFYSVDSSGKSAYSSALTIDARPRVVVLNPDDRGGRNYASKVRKDPWDFKQASDYNITPNASVNVANGLAVGNNTGPNFADTGVYLSLKDGKPIRTNKYHRVTMRVFLAGKFGLSGAPGGGMNARIIWHRADNGQYLSSDDIVVAPGWNVITIDLADFAPSELIEPYAAGFRWSGLAVDQFRIDPHEDSGVRTFKIDYVLLKADDKARKGKFKVSFRDKAFEPGSTAKIYVDNNRTGFDGTLVGTQAVKSGKNKFVLDRSIAGRGKKWIYIEVTDPSGTMSRSYSTGPVKL